MTAYTDGYWWSNDNLRLHYRDYAGSSERPPILCIPGLTRNARDFERLATRLAGAWRVICVDLRGRGESAYAKDAMSYFPLTYVQDIERLLAELKIERLVLIGTSLGGIVSMLLNSTGRERVEGVILNDVGPSIEQAGLDRIRASLGRTNAWPTWLHAARAVAEVNRDVYPDYAIEDWLAMTKRLYRLSAQGRIVADYDGRIAEPLRAPGDEAGVDLWPAFDALEGKPVLVVRGARSDVLAPATLAAMRARVPAITTVEVPGVGHAPTLDEPEAVVAIDRLLASLPASAPA